MSLPQRGSDGDSTIQRCEGIVPSMGWIRRHWIGIAAVATLIHPVFTVLRTLVQWGGDVDFIVSRMQDPGWVGAMLQWIVDPPGWAVTLMLLCGIALLVWEVRRKRQVPAAGGGDAALLEHARQLAERGRAALSLAIPQPSERDRVCRALRAGIYVGRMSVSAENLETGDILDIGIIAFNGTGQRIFVHRVRGHIGLKFYDAALIEQDQLPTPSIFEFHYSTTSIDPNTEFTIRLHQVIPQNMKARFLRVFEGDAVALYFDKLDVVMKSDPSGDEVTLKLWDGLRYHIPTEPVSAGM